MNRLMYLAIFAILLLTACSKDQPVSPDLVQVENVAGTYYRTLITSDGKDREFIVYVPESAVGNKNIPVVIMIHGTGSTGQIFHDDPDLWVPKAKMEGFITVHPTALVHCHFDNGLGKTTTKWSHGDLGENNTDMGGLPLCSGEELANDLEFFDMMIDVLKTDYSIDEKRIYVTGNSNGAGMGLRLAAERSDVFAAVAVNAGFQSLFLDQSITPRPMSIMITVGTNDNLFAEAIGESVPVSIHESLIQNISNFVQPILNIHALGDTSNYIYTEAFYEKRNTGKFLFNTSIINHNNSLRFIVIDGFGHNYNPALVNVFWDFFITQTLP